MMTTTKEWRKRYERSFQASVRNALSLRERRQRLDAFIDAIRFDAFRAGMEHASYIQANPSGIDSYGQDSLKRIIRAAAKDLKELPK